MMTENSQDKCLAKNNRWVAMESADITNLDLSARSCEIIGCHRAIIINDKNIHPSGSCLLAIINAVKSPEITQKGVNTIKPNSKYL